MLTRNKNVGKEKVRRDRNERGNYMKYQVVFIQGNYSAVDYETDNYDQAEEVRMELTSEMAINGERDFCYIIKTIK